MIAFRKTCGSDVRATCRTSADYILWYREDTSMRQISQTLYGQANWRRRSTQLSTTFRLADGTATQHDDGEKRDREATSEGADVFRLDNLTSQTADVQAETFQFSSRAQSIRPANGALENDTRRAWSGLARQIDSCHRRTRLRYMRFLRRLSGHADCKHLGRH